MRHVWCFNQVGAAYVGYLIFLARTPSQASPAAPLHRRCLNIPDDEVSRLSPHPPGTFFQGVKAQMMTRIFNPNELRGTAKVAYAESPGKYQAVWLPYKGSAGLAAVFVLPSTDAFPSVADAAKQISGQMVLDPKGWAPLSEPLALSLPRFKAEVKQLSLKEVGGWVGLVNKVAHQHLVRVL
jgi:hypothetical protein